MAGETTLPRAWLPLVDALGTVTELYTRLGVSKITFYRAAHGHRKMTPEFRAKVAALARELNVKSPVVPPPKKTKLDDVDMLLLEQMGRALSKGVKAKPSMKERLSKKYGDEFLIELAERDDVSPWVHAAAGALLGL